MVPFCMTEPCDMEKSEYETSRGAACGDEVAGMSRSLRLRSWPWPRCFGGRSSFAMLRTWMSEKEPEDWRMRGRRLRAFPALWLAWEMAGLSVLRASVSGEGCVTHSSDRSSSHGCVVLAIVVVVRVAGGAVAACRWCRGWAALKMR